MLTYLHAATDIVSRKVAVLMHHIPRQGSTVSKKQKALAGITLQCSN